MNFRRHYHGFKEGLIWYITNSILSNIPSKHIRSWGLRSLGIKMSNNVKFYQGFHIRNPKGITIEDYVNIGPKVLLDGRKGLIIRHNAVVAYDAIIWTLNHDYNDVTFCGKGASVEIGPYSWICSRSIVLPGITIGEGAIVASGAIVTKDVPAYSVVGGIPARIIGKREKKVWSYGYDHAKDYSHFI